MAPDVQASPPQLLPATRIRQHKSILYHGEFNIKIPLN